MKKFPHFILGFAALIVSSSTAAADRESRVSRSAEGMPRILSGSLGETELAFRFDEPTKRRSEPVLHLEWTTSAALSEEDATLTVRVDGAPIATWVLKEAGAGARAVRLPAVRAGYHIVRVSARARRDECATGVPDDRWISLQRAEVSWLTTVKQQASVGTTFDALGRGSARETHVDVPLDERPTTVEALIELDNWLRRLGRAPIDAAGARSAEVVVAFEESADCELPSVVAVEAGPPLRFSACEPSSLARFFAFVDDEALRSCHDSLCFYNTEELSRRGESVERPTAGARFTLEELGLPSGWMTRGEGSQTFEVTWVAPANIDVHRWPELELQATWNLGPIAGASGSVRVELNGRPIGSWNLSDANEGRLIARVPERHFDEKSWKFSVRIDLRSNVERCDAIDHNSIWFQVSETSELRVEHDRHYYAGLGQQWLANRGNGIDVALRSPSSSQAFAVAAVAHAMRTHRGRVRVVSACGVRPCLRLQAGPHSNESRIGQARVDEATFWRVRIHSSVTRMLPVDKSMIAHAKGPNVIDVYVDETFDSSGGRLSAPQLQDFGADLAFFLEEAWGSMGAKGELATTIPMRLPRDAPTRQSPRAPTMESYAVARIDIGMVLLGLLAVAWAVISERRFHKVTS
jgi:hypothetical protein